MGEAFGLLTVWLEKQRGHLIPKKVPVRLESGRVIEAIRWVNPAGEKKEGELIKPPRWLEEESYDEKVLLLESKVARRELLSLAQRKSWAEIIPAKVLKLVNIIELRDVPYFTSREETGDFHKIAGTYDKDSHSILIAAGASPLHTVAHELGHALYYNLDKQTQEENFGHYSQAKNYGAGAVSKYALTNEREFFAESFATYIILKILLTNRNWMMSEFLDKVMVKFADEKIPIEKEFKSDRDAGLLTDPPGVGVFDPDLPNLPLDINNEKGDTQGENNAKNVAMGTKGEEEELKKEDDGKIREEFGGSLSKYSLEEGRGNFTEKEEKGPDPASLEFYGWIDNVIEKSGLDIGGNQAYGAKIVGRAIEQRLYQSLQEEIDQYLSELKGDEEEETILEGLRQRVRAWQESNNNAINKAFAELFKRGFAAGMAVAGAKIGTFDQMALEILQKGKYTIGNRIVLFGDELIGAFAKIIKEAYTPKGVFSLKSLTEKMGQEVSTERYKLERIARTETSQVSNIGRLWGWDNDPDKYYYEYFWNSTPDKRVKEISRVRSKYNPLTFDEAKFLWFNQEQLLPSGKWQMDNYNQRCSLSRSPINEEKKGSRFVGQEESFHRTVDIGF